MEPERLSSNATIPWKYVFAPAWVAAFACGTVVLLADRDPMGWPCLLMTLSGLGVFYRKFAKVRHVYLREDRFYISDTFRQHEVPVSDLQRVEGRSWLKPETVVLYFRHDTGFGKRVDFVARWRFWSGFEEHSVLDELERLIRRHRRDWSLEP